MHEMPSIRSLLVTTFVLLCTEVTSGDYLVENQKVPQFQIDPLITEAIRDVGYFLRNYKFNELDPRFRGIKVDLFASFPKPPLYQLHPQVRKFCSDGKFLSCIKFLHEVAKQQRKTRASDTSYVIRTPLRGFNETPGIEWSDALISSVDNNCQNLIKQDEEWKSEFSVFGGPLQRFQWRVTASYYMCWYTLQQRPSLAHFGEDCDNFASCLHPIFGAKNKDPRANDSLPYACALYSFCPDPCCPEKHVKSMEECIKSSHNPCLEAKPQSLTSNKNLRLVTPLCKIEPERNLYLSSIMLGHWNLSCPCPDIGYEWSSQFNACVDIDECNNGGETAEKATIPCGGPQVSSCFNLPGEAGCVCRWGYTKDSSGHCVRDAILEEVLAKLDRDML